MYIQGQQFLELLNHSVVMLNGTRHPSTSVEMQSTELQTRSKLMGDEPIKLGHSLNFLSVPLTFPGRSLNLPGKGIVVIVELFLNQKSLQNHSN